MHRSDDVCDKGQQQCELHRHGVPVDGDHDGWVGVANDVARGRRRRCGFRALSSV